MLTVDEIKAQNKASYFKAEMRGKKYKKLQGRRIYCSGCCSRCRKP